uniref:Uncharacterized protein n=1 Tax=Timema shepardi TaxID=629360 RepID=A0A7R9BAT3_TIMSH|nr:unnamed protein product [Timema shepardi]
MPACCSQVGLRAEAKVGLVAATRCSWLLLPANARLLLSDDKAGLVAATRWGWLLLPANASILLLGGAESRGQGGAGGSD